MSEPTLSVLMTNYNHGRFIGEALTAMLSQSRPADEIIVADDASTDDSVEIIDEFRARHPQIRLIRNEKNGGVVNNCNVLLRTARGRYLVFAASDDRVLPNFFASSLAAFERYPAAGLVSGVSKIMSEDGKELGDFHRPTWAKDVCWMPPPVACRMLQRYGSWFMGNVTVYRRDALLAVGPFREQLGAFCDGFASMTIAMRDGVCYVPEAFGLWRRMESGFAATDTGKETRYSEIGAKAMELMRSEYSDLYPSAFVDAWLRRWQAAGCVQSATREQVRRGRSGGLRGRTELALRKAACIARFRPPVMFRLIEEVRRRVLTRR
jgi:glycosyltransferase involved in cell wall biosynthesis